MDKIIDFFLKPENGILGVFVVILIFVVIWEEREKKDLRKDNKDLALELRTLAEKRVNDLERIKDADFALLEKIRSVEAEKSDKVRDMVGSVLSIAQNLQSLFNLKGKE
jgi:hypothetical protein